MAGVFTAAEVTAGSGRVVISKRTLAESVRTGTAGVVDHAEHLVVLRGEAEGVRVQD